LSAEKSRWSRFRERKSWSQTMHELCCYCRWWMICICS
jgi:hypothetical protein